jgi:hypothetical protein
MDETFPATELILQPAQRSLGHVQLDWVPQPGTYVHHEGQAYLVLERRHQYQFRTHRYHLSKINLHVQVVSHSLDKSWIGDRWVIGDTTCQFNAQSELVRCAVNPAGPCDGCTHYQTQP